MMIELNDFLNLRSQLPMIDVRSENEFAQGHIAMARNIPILNNAERVAVGTIYKQQGQSAAIKEGFRLVGPRLVDIIDTAQTAGKECLVHCWRGGMRSSNFCQFVGMAGVKIQGLSPVCTRVAEVSISIYPDQWEYGEWKKRIAQCLKKQR
jgi:tRNA 2-selenouridine synthase